jgi:hypothetical protein
LVADPTDARYSLSPARSPARVALFAHSLGVVDAADAMAEVLGPDLAFTATAEVFKLAPSASEPRRSEMRFAYRDGRTRLEPDFTTDTELPAELLREMTEKSTNERVILLGPEGGYVVYPKLGAYHPQQLAREEKKSSSTPTHVARATELGREVVRGHPCRKVELRDDGDSRQLVITKWEAEDMAGFPIQIEIRHGAGAVTFLFDDVEREEPSPALFEIPKTYKAYASPTDLDDSLTKPAPTGGNARSVPKP